MSMGLVSSVSRLSGALLLAGCLNEETMITSVDGTDGTAAESTAAMTGTTAEPPTPTTSGAESTGSSTAADSSESGVAASSTESETTGAPAPVCGDGVVEGDETCDDGDDEDDDECPGSCLLAFCGDGFVRAEVEACDDGNKFNDDACTNTCTVATCGDGVLQDGVEACDDGNQEDGDYCTGVCDPATCGDGVVHVDVEACDDGDQEDDDACLSDCSAAVCGDGVLQVGVEACDDGDDDDGDACLSDCSDAKCGDGVVHVGVEACDDGNDVDGDACLNDCSAAKCGDGVVQDGVEECDDANAVNTDACSNKCVLTPKTVVLGPGDNTTQQGGVNLGVAFNDACPMGQALVGFSGVLKTNVHAALKGMCGLPNLNVQGAGFVVKVGAGTALTQRGGTGDTPWTRSCPADQVLVGFSGRAGTTIDQLVLTCAPLLVSEAVDGRFSVAPGAATPLMAIGGAGGAAFVQTDCPIGQVGAAQRLRAGTLINAFGYGCNAVSLGY